MHFLKRICVTLILLSLFLTPVYALEDDDFKAVWVTTVYNLDYPSKGTTDSKQLKSEASSILDNIASMGMNAVILQVRPASDSFYKSDIFPWSRFLTGQAGTAPSDGFDPLEYWIDEAHKRGLELHAWINPYRITKSNASNGVATIDMLPDGHPAKINPSYIVSYSDGELYFDPGIPEVRNLIIDGAVEICENYDIDGIHLDDYFYPGTNFNDDNTFLLYGKDFSSKDDWRRNNVDIFVSELYAAVKNVNADIAFGISPFGIWANSSTNPLGSNTNGGESYTQHYADTRKWVKEGILDYIAPQIYWSIGHKNADYDTLTRWWADVVKDTNVKLYIGHAAYKVGSEWSDVFALMAQLELNRGIKEISGSIFFRYGFMKKDVKNAVKSFYTGKKTEPGKYSLKINLPAKDITTSQSDYYVGGTSDSAYPLYLNGELISSRSGDGFFGTLVKLEKGENVLKFTQNDQSVTRTITHRCLSSSSKGQSEATITSMFPTVNTYYAPGDTVTFTCTAPIGSIVRITFDGKTYQMYPDNTTPPDFRSVHLTTYTYDFTLPKGNNLSLGSAVYSMAYRGKKVRLLSNGEIYVISSENVTYARVKNDLTSGYSKPSSSGGPNVILSKNMSDIVTGRSGSYVKLGSNLWVYARNLEFYGKKSETSKLSNASMTVDVNGVNILTFMINDGTVYAKYDDTERTLNISVSPCKMGPKLRISSKSMFSSVDISQNNQKAIYRLKLKDEFTLGGYYTEAADGVLSLHVNPGISANIGYKPLSGHTIVVDAGHGGYDTGALGLLGADMPEKAINLDISLKLRDELTSLGAKVIMTRETDTYLSLEERLDISYLIKPDLFISVHCNSMNTNVDSSKVSGFSVFFREKTSSDAAKTIFNYLNDNLDLDNKGCHQANFYVVRGTWSPAVIFESAFMPNPSDFENLINEEWQAKLAKTLAMAITEYFK